MQKRKRFLAVRKRREQRFRLVVVAAVHRQTRPRDDSVLLPLLVAERLGTFRRLFISAVRADIHQPVDDLAFRGVHAFLRAELVCPVSVDERVDILCVRRQPPVQLVLGVQTRAIWHAPARHRQHNRRRAEQTDDHFEPSGLLFALLLLCFHLLNGLLAGTTQILARLLFEQAFLAPHSRINGSKRIRLERLRAFPSAAQALVVARPVRPSADAQPDRVVLPRITDGVRARDRAEPVQLASRLQGVGRILANVPLFPAPDDAVLIPDLLDQCFNARHAIDMLRSKRAVKALAGFAVRARADEPAAQPRIFRVETDDVHLNAVDHLIRKVEKLDIAENLPVFIGIFVFPLDRHADDLNRTG